MMHGMKDARQGAECNQQAKDLNRHFSKEYSQTMTITIALQNRTTDSPTPLLSHYCKYTPRKWCQQSTHYDYCNPIHTPKGMAHTQISSTEDWVKNMWYTYMMEYRILQ